MSLRSSLSFGSCFALFWLGSCATPPAIVDEVDAQGEALRQDKNELAVEAVSDDEATNRMLAYEMASGTESVPITRTASTAAQDRVAGEIETRVEDEEEREPEVPAEDLKARMDAFLGMPDESRLVTADGDLLSDSAPGTPAFDPFKARNCPPEGSAKSTKNKNQNKLKNRARRPHAADFDADVTFEELRKPGDDRQRWSTANAATIVCYVKKIQATGAETCNCGVKDKALTDSHFDLISGPNDTGQPVIAEITPIWRLIHKEFGQEDWSSTALRNKYQSKKVRISGWLFYDTIHEHEADNTDPNNSVGKKNWRATAWEIHPITKIEIVQ